MIKLLEYLTKNISGTKEIKIEAEKGDDGTNFKIFAPQKVMGLLIGKEGKTIRAIRLLARARATLDKERITVTLEDNN